MSTINVSKTNPLNAIYKHWLYLGGEPKTPEDLCHFMRVCMFWWLFRWLFSSETYDPSHPADTYRHNTGDRFPRVGIFFIEFVLILFVTHLINEGIVLATALFILAGGIALSIIITFAIGAVDVSRKVNRNEAFGLFKAYLSARKQRICPFIEVEK